ncbi:MAG: coproporphyrinogen dehydrogenase HemZ [Alistipes sp.]|nr:coproporphyrinogen dehydrogenase HemZ [Alistipes sp.]
MRVWFRNMILFDVNDREYYDEVQVMVKAFYPAAQFLPKVREKEDVEKTIRVSVEDDAVTVDIDGVKQKEPIQTSAKETLKTTLYRTLSQDAGRELPWGSLTGVRPVKLVLGRLEEGMPEDGIRAYMKERYMISDAKLELSLKVAKREKRLLERLNYRDGYSIYIGIPFCPTTCLYCSFTSYPIGMWQKRTDEYVDALLSEMEFAAGYYRGRKPDTVYFGGGTPTTLEPYQLDKILSALEEKFDLSGLKELTVESGRPDSVTEEKLRVLKAHGVTRISVNPQTMNQKTLDRIGRRHTTQQVREAFYLARKCGFDNINMDLIMGLPGETFDDVKNTMEEIKQLAPDNLTVHSLAVKRAAALNLWKDKFGGAIRNTDEIIDMTADYAAKMGLSPYYLYRQKNMAGNFENVGYAKEGKESLYNILIMEEKQTIVALGAGGASKFVFPGENRIERVENVKDVKNYIERVDEMIERKRNFLNGI